MRVRSLDASEASHLLHKLVHKRVLIVSLDHPCNSVLEEVNLELCIRVKVIVHVQFFARVHGIFLVLKSYICLLKDAFNALWCCDLLLLNTNDLAIARTNLS